MPLLKVCNTVPELFQFLTEEYSNRTKSFIMMHKVEGKYVGISYQHFKEETEDFAYGLATLGVTESDRIAIISENRPEWIYSDMAILGLGAVDVPLYPSLTSDSIEYILNNSESRGIIVSNKFQLNKILKIRENCSKLEFIIILNEKDSVSSDENIFTFKEVQLKGGKLKQEDPIYFKDKMHKVRKDDLCTIIYTSGTTGEPKGVLLTHWNILSNSKAALEILPIYESDVWLSFLPLCHIFERMGGYYTGFASGGTMCYAESIEAVSTNLMEIKPTLMTSVPRLFERIYSKVIKNVDSQPVKKQKIFYWALNA
ncbi:MAG: AMP-binding protein, partial [Ignavibacteriaceae bacterium]